MKKLFPLILLALTSTCLAGCGEENNPNSFRRLYFSHEFTKKDYLYDDEWDFSGLEVTAVKYNGQSKILNENEYTLTWNKKYPRNYVVGLNLTAVLNVDKNIKVSKVFKGITVQDEIYDAQAEIDEYYSDCNLTLKTTNLMNELHRHSFSKHTYFVKYGETDKYLGKTMDSESPDLIPGQHQTQFFYTGLANDYRPGSREHVWACNDSDGLWTHNAGSRNYVDDSDYIGGGSDLYHIRSCDSTVNTARGDAPFVCFDDSEHSSKKNRTQTVSDGGPYVLKTYGGEYDGTKVEFADLVEPANEFKGDIARIIAYIYMHYHTNTKTPSKYRYMTGNLDLTDALGYGSSRAKEILKKWNKLDPVNDIEKRRNHTVELVQGNRNPFVDYPELIDEVF